MAKDKGGKCVFCELVKGRAPAFKIYEDEFSMVILDINPFAKGHCLVLSKRHVPWWHDLTERETESIFRVARVVAQKIMKTFRPDFVGMHARGRRIPHTHIFLVPTYPDDLLDRFFKTLEKAQESPKTLVKLGEKKSLAEISRLLRRA
ncbi:MAG: HIT family protein [Deltaproteobacteria bacterium]|nr:HIT family protein [Deltaproteobacteria bacterium]